MDRYLSFLMFVIRFVTAMCVMLFFAGLLAGFHWLVMTGLAIVPVGFGFSIWWNTYGDEVLQNIESEGQ